MNRWCYLKLIPHTRRGTRRAVLAKGLDKQTLPVTAREGYIKVEVGEELVTSTIKDEFGMYERIVVRHVD